MNILNIYIIINSIYKNIKHKIHDINEIKYEIPNNFTEINLIPAIDIFDNDNLINIFDPIFINFVLD